jgi:MOSC domain-containing protein YiiM
MPNLISVNVGTPVEIGRTYGTRRIVLSGIIKKGVEGPVLVRFLNLDGDKQADLAVHGGVRKAVYVYPSEHYRFWKEKFQDKELGWGAFGENFTTEGILETEVHIGDQFEIGSAAFEVTEPRFPCYKLGMRLGDRTIEKSFLESEKSGFYLMVLKEGEVRAGDPILRILESKDSETIASVVQAVKKKGGG